MKKFKKFFAVILSLAMVLGMSITSFAASTDKGTIKITNLTTGEQATTINAYKFISVGDNANSWVIEEWAEDFVTTEDVKVNGKKVGTKYVVSDPAGLAAAIPADATPAYTEDNVSTTEVEIKNVDIGAYVVLASTVVNNVETNTINGTTYTPMIADVASYSNDGILTAKNVEIVAKASNYAVDKSADDNFVKRGEEVTFTIKTTFPRFDNPASQDNSYVIVDTPNGLRITEVTSVKLGDNTTPVDSTKYTITDNQADGEATTYPLSYVIDLTQLIGGTNNNAGKSVTVEYKAVVTSDAGYSNTANAYRDGVKLGEGSEEGFTGSITVKKVDSEDPSVTLAGAEFQVNKVGSNNKLWFVEVSAGVYKLAEVQSEGTEGTAPNAKDKTQTIVVAASGNNKGTVKVQGLDEGTYHFAETKAPEGYSVDDNSKNIMSDVKIDAGNANVDVTDGTNYPNTKLSSLPSTGGIGTTIFTIGGCVIMIAAAALFFANRRRAAK